MKNDFKRSLSTGKIAVEFCMDYLEKLGFACTKPNEGYFPDYDFIAEGYDISFTIECKNDVYANKSGRIAIEVYNPRQNKVSGLFSTNANYWFQFVNNEYNLMIPVTQLKDFVKSNNPNKIIEVGGDNNSKMYLYNMERLNGFFNLKETTKEFFIGNDRYIQ